jgi:excisionase family DNA binding protein
MPTEQPEQAYNWDFYTTAEVAAILMVSKRTVLNWIQEGSLPAIRLGASQRLIRVRRQDLEAFIEEGMVNS